MRFSIHRGVEGAGIAILISQASALLVLQCAVFHAWEGLRMISCALRSVRGWFRDSALGLRAWETFQTRRG